MKRAFLCVWAVTLWLGMGSPVWAGFVEGSTYHLDFVNFPDTFSADVTLDQTTKSLDNGNLLLSETIVPVNPDVQWLEFNFRTPNGRPLANNLNALWQVSVTGLQLSQPANFTSVFSYWSLNGTPVSPIQNFGELTGAGATNPIDPAQSPVYFNSGFSADHGNPASFTPLAFSNPYNFIFLGGMNPATDNDFHFGVQFTNTTSAIPEPASMLMLTVGLIGVAPVVWLKRRWTASRTA
jgi:hypothetical protein